jgi:hypothetical protein
MSGGGQKVLSKPSADSFAVGRRQKPELPRKNYLIETKFILRDTMVL